MNTVPAPEFSRPLRIDQIGRLSGSTTIVADAAEREALMRRFGLIELDLLEADYGIGDENGSIVARGRVRARLSQTCVATGLPVPENMDADFVLRFVVESDDLSDADELELDAQDCDTIGYDGQVIDMGEAVAETMALTMEIYPRAPQADAVLEEAGVLSEEQASPFAVLQALKNKE
ncbi:YceD family protein [Sphingobium sp.]|uniref:YceD family protein n=1 Tax=Sphingobium sp. TaxID=1912891 RepID=UPI003BB4F250